MHLLHHDMIFKRSPHVLVHILFNLRSEIQNVQTTPRKKKTLPEPLNYPKVIQRSSWSSSKLPKQEKPRPSRYRTGSLLSAHDVRDALRVAWRIPRCSKTLGSLESLVAPTYGAMHALGSKSHMARYGDFKKKRGSWYVSPRPASPCQTFPIEADTKQRV